MIDIETYDDHPNFSVIVPQPCNMRCAFCSNKVTEEMHISRWLPGLEAAIGLLPEKFQQVSITGGEPTLFPGLFGVMRAVRKRFRKVVISTNGAELANKLMTDLVWADYINLSRHAVVDFAAADRFGCMVDELPKYGEAEIKELVRRGTGVTLTKVVLKEEEFRASDVMEYAKFAKGLGCTGAAFRYDMHEPDGLEMGWVPSGREYWEVEEDNECPVCRTIRADWHGFPIFFKASVCEPLDHLDVAYELIYTSDGVLSTTWDGKNPVTEEDEMTRQDEQRLERIERTLEQIVRRLERDDQPHRRASDRCADSGGGGSSCHGGGHC